MAWKKFAIGDQVVFCKTNKHYPIHNDHVGEILSIRSYPKTRGAGTRVIYEMKCECGSVLHPQAEHLSLKPFRSSLTGIFMELQSRRKRIIKQLM